MGWIGDIAGGSANVIMGPRNRREAKAAAKANREYVGSLDWEPTYASAQAPSMQVSESPVARSYLESMLTGNNPDLTMRNAPNSDHIKMMQQQSKDQMYGTTQEMLAREAAEKERLNSMHVDQPPPLAGPAALRGANAAAAGTRPDQGLDGGQKALGAVSFGATAAAQKQKNAKAGLAWDMQHPESGKYGEHVLTPEEQANLTAAVHDPNATPESIQAAWENSETWLDANRPKGEGKNSLLDGIVNAHSFGLYGWKTRKRDEKALKEWKAKHPNDDG